MPSLGSLSGTMERQAETCCVGCGTEKTESYELILDGVDVVSIRLCEDCYRECYESILSADWIEEPS